MLRRGYASLGNASVASIIFYRLHNNNDQSFSNLEKELKMNKRSIVIAVAVAALMVFGLGAFAYKNSLNNKSEAQPQTSTTAAANAENNTLIRPHSPIIGPENAPVTIVEFLDPSCEACRAYYPIVKEVLNRYPNDVRLVVRYAPFHPGSDQAVGIIEAARLQNVFVPVLEALFERQPQWAVHGAPNLNLAWDIAAQAGLDVEKAKKDLATINVASILEQDVADINSNGVNGTPTFFINGVRLTSLGQKQLNDAVDSQIASIQGR